MKISVLLCVFNGQESISRAIESILEQDFINFEFLIVNDGSTDNTEKIIYSYMEKDSRIKYFYKSHTGLTNSLIFGLCKASGEWIARMDADDYSKSNRLSMQLKFVENNRNVVLLGSNFSLIKENKITYKSNLNLIHDFLVNDLIKSKAFFPHSSAFFSREKAIQVGGYRSSFLKAQDHDLWLRLSEKGKIACHKKNLVLIYDHQNRVTNLLSGYPQYIYAFAAIVSYFARKEKLYHLESEINKNNIEIFLENLNQYVSNYRYGEILFLKESFKKLFLSKNYFSIIIKGFYLIFQNLNILFLILKNHFLSVSLPYSFFIKNKNNL